jgi:transposase
MKAKRYRYAILFRTIFVFRGFVYNEFIQKEDVIHVFLKRIRKTATCPNCGKRTNLTGEEYIRTVKDLNISTFECFVTFHQNKVYCKCGFRGHEKLSFVRPYSRCTIRYEQYVFSLCQMMTLTDVCSLTNLNWKTVKDIDIHYTMERIIPLRDLSPKSIGIDEIAYEKGHEYLTIVRDAELNDVIWIGIGRKESTLDEFFKELGMEKSNDIKLAVMDMWDPYIASVRNHCRNVEIVFDKFHIVKAVNKALDEIRKKEFAKAEEEQRIDMKRKRFVILRRRKNLSPNQIETLDEMMRENDTLYRAYLLKEHIADIFDEENASESLKRFDDWKRNVIDTGLKPFIGCLKMMTNYFYGIENYFKHKITNAGSEGINTKINIIKRKAYGYSDLKYFMLKIYQACGMVRF